MDRESDTIWLTSAAVLFTLLVLFAGAGVASAAVSGDFSSSYDGYNDDSESDTRGNEISVSGSIQFSGENAVNPRIFVRSTQNTVIDDSSVRLLQPGGSSIDFRRDNVDDGVRYRAEEVPAGTQLNLEFVVYPVSGLTQEELRSAQVVVRYERPDGETEEQTIDVQTAIPNTPPKVINSLEQGDQIGTVQQILSYIGGAALVVLLLLVGLKIVGGSNQPGGPA